MKVFAGADNFRATEKLKLMHRVTLHVFSEAQGLKGQRQISTKIMGGEMALSELLQIKSVTSEIGFKGGGVNGKLNNG